MQKRDFLKTIALIACIIVVTIGSSLLLNLVTGSKIASDAAKREELAAQQAAGVLLEVFPGATGFEDITSTLTIDPASGVSAIHKETSGKGYVFVASKTTSPMKDVVTVTVGVDMEGKITGVKEEFANPGDYRVSGDTINSFVGKDSTLADIVLTSKATVSSETIKAAVAAGFEVLAANELMKAAAKTPEQVFESLLLTVCDGFIKGADLTASGNIYQAYKSSNNSVVVAYVNKGETKLLALASVTGAVAVYQGVLLDEATQTYELRNVTADNADVVEEVKAFALANISSKFSKLEAKVSVLYPNATEITEIEINTFGSVVAAVSFVVEGATYYGYLAAPINGFSKEAMEIFVFLDSNDTIVKVNISQLFYEEEYFMGKPNITKDEYQNRFNGIVGEAYDGSQSLMAGATMSSNATDQAIKDVIAAYASKGGNN